MTPPNPKALFERSTLSNQRTSSAPRQKEIHPLRKSSERDMRNHMDLNILKERQRFPRGE